VWKNISEQDLDRLLALEKQNALQLPLPSHMLLVSACRWLHELVRPVVRLEERDAAQWLGALFMQDELRPYLVSLDEEPFTIAAEPLRWSAAESTAPDGRLRAILLQLADAEGREPPKPLRYLPGATPLYLAADTVFRGPAMFEEGTAAHSSVEIPA
jgi:hypothetical protein